MARAHNDENRENIIRMVGTHNKNATRSTNKKYTRWIQTGKEEEGCPKRLRNNE